MLTISDLTYRIAGRSILSGASLSLSAGQRAGLVGRNGTGKSTLLKLISGQLQADSGEIRMAGNSRIGMLSQEAPSGPESLLDTVLAADTERAALLTEAEHCSDPSRIADIHQRLSDIGAHAAPARAAEILHGLGFDAEAQARPCADFSGGWRMRVALAAVLFSAPDLLLLDEPTNHLDLEATLWLEDYLRRYPHTILIVSHDRDLLNKAVDRIVHLHDQKLTLYGGNYDTFERTRAEKLALQSATAAKQEAQRKHMQAFVDRFRYKASKARQAQSRLKALAKLPPITATVEERGIEFDFPVPAELPPPLITLDKVDVGYEPDKPILKRLDLRLDPDDRIALLGSNGNGKSTFVKLLAGRLAAMSGEMRRSSKLRVGYFAQHQAEELDLQATPLQTMERLAPNLTAQQCRAHLGRFDFGVEKVETKIAHLSGGEKARLLLALMSHSAPNILLLDEPTNHLDIDSRRALVQAINDFAGAVVLISHDPTLIELTIDRLWLVKDGTCRPFEGDLDDYRKLLESANQSAARGSTPADSNRKEQRRQAAGDRSGRSQLKKTAEQSGIAVEKYTQALKLIEDKLADPNFYSEPAERVAEWQKKHADVQRRLAEAEEAWLEAQMALEE
ncbi:ABC-F family ATP-binding cassette domain-containing protein [Dongia soli]|uniref:ABC-F family ATP-binding cassette domain-containing protein n=1 Tax=Dongia soli TaxID=600628 RepID=A0ABU5E505_9PROT|nr:ABC-F family ATP-binding cassette domain-containing protein [Dongia soli]MDY0881340.1 ABC-F family ATP-binding cassette domain-containing protein [Dongia soli]